MDKKELDRLWQVALHESVQEGEQFTRYRFAQKVADRCAEIVTHYTACESVAEQIRKEFRWEK